MQTVQNAQGCGTDSSFLEISAHGLIFPGCSGSIHLTLLQHQLKFQCLYSHLIRRACVQNKAVHVRALAQLDMRPSRLAPSHQPNHSSPTASTQIASRQLLTSANEAKKRLVIAVVDVFNGTRCEGSVGSIGYFEAVDQIVLHELRPHTPCQGRSTRRH